LTVGIGPEVVPYTGEHALEVTITNRGRSSCVLDGYPAVTILAGKRALPFSYDDGGGPYVSTAAPKLVALHPGDRATFVVAKYRCDVGDLATATSFDIWLPGVAGEKALPISGDGVGTLTLCRKAEADGPADPGNTVVVSPIESGSYAR
jgi:hypothetical protein